MTSNDILDQLNTAVTVCRIDFSVLQMNPAAEQLFAVSAKQATDQALDRLVRFPDTVVEALRGPNKNIIDRHCQLVDHQGQNHWVDFTATETSFSVDGQANTYLLLECVDLDRHQRIVNEGHLQTQQTASKTLLRGFAHEMKNPLGGLRGAAQLLGHELGPDSELLEYTQVIVDEADRLSKLIDRLWLPGSKAIMRSTNVHAVVERVLALVEAEGFAGINYERDYDPSIPEINADFDLLLQAMLNLGRNAALVVSESGVGDRICFKTRVIHNFTINKNQHRVVVCLSVFDNGPGVAEEIRDGLFLPLVSGRHQGTGLGLSTAQLIVSQHGGLIECDSSPGATEFTVFLPLEPQNG